MFIIYCLITTCFQHKFFFFLSLINKIIQKEKKKKLLVIEKSELKIHKSCKKNQTNVHSISSVEKKNN